MNCYRSIHLVMSLCSIKLHWLESITSTNRLIMTEESKYNKDIALHYFTSEQCNLSRRILTNEAYEATCDKFL